MYRLDFCYPQERSSSSGGSDLAYSYTVKYDVPEFDWERLGVEPRLTVAAEVEKTFYGGVNYLVPESVPVQTAVETITKVEGKFKAPNDRSEWRIGICLTFEDKDRSKPRTEGLIGPITYEISRTDYPL